MTIETTNPTSIADLNPSFPASTDLVKEGDDHIRLTKQALKTQFPLFNTPITASSADINRVTDTLKPNTTSGVDVNQNINIKSGVTLDIRP